MKDLEINTMVFLQEVVRANRSKVLTAMPVAINKCRKAAAQDRELSQRGKIGMVRLSEFQTAIHKTYGLGELYFEGTGIQILAAELSQLNEILTSSYLCEGDWVLAYTELAYMLESLLKGEWFE